MSTLNDLLAKNHDLTNQRDAAIRSLRRCLDDLLDGTYGQDGLITEIRRGLEAAGFVEDIDVAADDDTKEG